MSLDFLTQDEKDLITSDVDDLVEDEEASIDVTYKTFTGAGTFDRTTGAKTPTFTTKTVRAFRFPITEREIGQGPYQLGDVRYLIRKSDVTLPTKNDRVVDGSDERFIVDFSTDPLRIFHDILARQP